MRGEGNGVACGVCVGVEEGEHGAVFCDESPVGAPCIVAELCEEGDAVACWERDCFEAEPG